MSSVHFLTQRSDFLKSLKTYERITWKWTEWKHVRIMNGLCAGEHQKQCQTSWEVTVEPPPLYASNLNGSSEHVVQCPWTMARNVIMESQVEPNIWVEAISNSPCLGIWLLCRKIASGIPIASWFNWNSHLSALLSVSNKGYVFQYLSSVIINQKAQLRTIYGHIFRMESEHALYLINFPCNKSILLWRKIDFPILHIVHHLHTFQLLRSVSGTDMSWERLYN